MERVIMDRSIQAKSLSTKRQQRTRVDNIIVKVERLTETTIQVVELSRQSPTTLYMRLSVSDPVKQSSHTIEVGLDKNIIQDALYCAHLLTTIIFAHVQKRPGCLWFN